MAEIDLTKHRRKLDYIYWPLFSAIPKLRHQAEFGDRRRGIPEFVLTLARNASFWWLSSNSRLNVRANMDFSKEVASILYTLSSVMRQNRLDLRFIWV